MRRESTSRAAISGLDSPSSTSAATLSSMSVSDSQPLLRPPVLAVRPAPDPVAAELGLHPVQVGLGPEELVHLDRLLEHQPRARSGPRPRPGTRPPPRAPWPGAAAVPRPRTAARLRAARRGRGRPGRGSRARWPAGAGSAIPRRGRSTWPVSVCAVVLSPILTASRTASASRSSVSPMSSRLPSSAAVSTASASASSPACSRSSDRASSSGGIRRCPNRSACGSAAARWRRAASGSLRWKLITARVPNSPQAAAGSFRSIGTAVDLRQRVVPAPGLEEQLAEDAVRLRQPERGADLVRELP